MAVQIMTDYCLKMNISDRIVDGAGCFVNVEPTQNIIYQGLINIYYPDVNTIIFAVAFIGLIILIKKLKKELLDNTLSNGNEGNEK